MFAAVLAACGGGDGAGDAGVPGGADAQGDSGGEQGDGETADGGGGDDGGGAATWPESKVYVLLDGDAVAVLDADDLGGGVTGTLDLAGNGVSWVAAEGQKHRLYTSNKQRGTFSAFETVGMTQLPGSPYAAGQMPAHVAIHRRHNLVIVVNNASHDFNVYESGTMTQVAGSPFVCAGQSPLAMAIDDNESRAFILNQGGSHDVAVYEVFGPDQWTLRPERLPTGEGPVSLVADSPDRRLYIANAYSNNVTAYGMDDLVQLPGSPFPAGRTPGYMALDPVGGTLYTANAGDDLVTMYTASSMQNIGSINMTAGSRPVSLSVDGDRNRLYVAAAGDDSVRVYALDTAAPVGAPVALPGKPLNIDHD
ncbi:MAG: YncE family protein [Deltaproteobacteria bacterium]|nr:YncE family protein [Deltaproteobacteria bacterium]